VIIVALAALVACGGDETDETTGTTADGSATRSSALAIDDSIVAVEIPASFPADVPLPADVVYQEAQELSGGASTIFDITGWFDGAAVPAARAYLSSLEAAGYEVTSRTEATASLLFVAVGSEWFVSAGFYPDPIRNVGTLVGITVGPATDAPASG
jgi:hypothetical protein